MDKELGQKKEKIAQVCNQNNNVEVESLEVNNAIRKRFLKGILSDLRKSTIKIMTNIMKHA